MTTTTTTAREALETALNIANRATVQAAYLRRDANIAWTEYDAALAAGADASDLHETAEERSDDAADAAAAAALRHEQHLAAAVRFYEAEDAARG